MKPSNHVLEAHTTLYIPSGPADRELAWFFSLDESELSERQADAAHAERKILEWFVEIGDYDAGVLKVAYEARPWPLRLRKELGRLTGVVVRVAAAEVGLPDDDRELAALEQRVAARLDEALSQGARIVAKRQLAASPLLRRAFVAYQRERGGSVTPVLRGVT